MSIRSIITAWSPPFVQRFIARIEQSPMGYRLLKGMFWSIAGTVISRGMVLAAMVVIARMLGKVAYGELGIIQSTVVMFGTFAGFGLGLTAIKYVSEFRRSNPLRAGQIIMLSGTFAFLTGGAMAVGLYAFAPWLAVHSLNAPHLAGALRIGALVLFINALNGAQTGALSGFEAFKAIAQVNFATGLFSLPCLVLGTWFGGLTGAVWALAINLAFNWLLNHLALRQVARMHQVPFVYRNFLHQWPVLLRFSLPVTLSSIIVGPVRWLGDSMLVNTPGGYGELGLYSAISQLFLPAIFLTSTLANVYLPILSNSYSAENPSIFRSHARKMLKTNSQALLAICAGFLVLAPIVLPVFGEDYRFPFLLILLVVLATALSAFGNYLNSVLIAMHMPWYGACGNGLWGLFYLGLFYFLTRRGAVGMAFSMTLSLMISQIFVEYFMFRKLFEGEGGILPLLRSKMNSALRRVLRKDRFQMSTTTAFFRNLDQLKTVHELAPSPRRIYVFACSEGCEAYSLAIFFREQSPDCAPEILGFDIDRKCVEKAAQGVYSARDLLYEDNRLNEAAVKNYLERYLEPNPPGNYRVKEEIRSQCAFQYGNVLDGAFMNGLAKAGIVFFQNALIHMTEEQNEHALKSLVNLVHPGGILVIGGMRLPVRARLTRAMKLDPVTANCRVIHESQKDLRQMWDKNPAFNRPYYAMPPFEETEDWPHRFSTIFRIPENLAD